MRVIIFHMTEIYDTLRYALRIRECNTSWLIKKLSPLTLFCFIATNDNNDKMFHFTCVVVMFEMISFFLFNNVMVDFVKCKEKLQ